MNERLRVTHQDTGVRLLFVTIVALIVHGSFFPWDFHVRPLRANPLWILAHSCPAAITRSIIRDIGVNIGVYVPLGVSGYIAFAKTHRHWARVAIPVLTATCLSVLVECLQLFQETRTCSIVDVICNILGAIVGVALVAAIGTRLHQPWIRNLLRRGDVLLVAAGWLVWQLFPMFPIWKWSLFEEKLHVLVSWNGGTAALTTAFTGWLIATCILEALGVARPARWMSACAAVLLPVRGMLIHGRFVGLPEILGTILALLVWQFVLADKPLRTQITAVIAVTYLCARQVLPFAWVWDAERFVWVPFTASLQGDSLSDFAILIEKTFLYSAAVWVLWSSGMTLRRSAAVVVGVLAVTESIQMGIPGRVPETTDPLLALLASVVFGIAKTITADISQAGLWTAGTELGHTVPAEKNETPVYGRHARQP